MDANAKHGKEINPGDPKEQSKIGKLLEKVLIENNLVLVNAQDVSKGTITRHRETKNGVEESVLDYFIGCMGFYSLIVSMLIDENSAYSLTKYSNKSDHNTLILEHSLNWNTAVQEPVERIEVFNNKKNEDFNTVVKLTTGDDELKTFYTDDDEDIEVETQRWLKRVIRLISD